MFRRPRLSVIVPTRQRVACLRRFLDSLAVTALRPEAIEVLLVIDADDAASRGCRHPALPLRHVVVPPGLPMGALNMAGYEASTGDHIMLLNDDVVARTHGWDARVLACFQRFPDDIVLVHVNDTVFRDRLCVFPLVSRTFCELAGGICPREYLRYRIDDHIEDVFNLLALLGKRRSVYLPDVVFEHQNTILHPRAGQVYASDPAILAQDAPRFDALFGARKELALRLLNVVQGSISPEVLAAHRRLLEGVADPFCLRWPGRQRVDRAAHWRLVLERLGRPTQLATCAAGLLAQARDLIRCKGYYGLARALGGPTLRRLLSGASRSADRRRLAWEARHAAPV